MILAIDTETSGLYHRDLAASDPSQPWPVQIGMQLFDGRWNLRGAASWLVKPDGWSIQPDAQEVHGIAEADCHRYGVPLPAILLALRGAAANATKIIGHGVQFDRSIIASALAKLGATGDWWLQQSRKFACTMELSTDVLRLPGEFGQFKFPTLEEAHNFFFPNQPYTPAHRADEDIQACVRVARRLEEIGRWNTIL